MVCFHRPGDLQTPAPLTSLLRYPLHNSSYPTSNVLYKRHNCFVPHLEYAIQANCPYLKKDINHLERIQRAATRWMKGLRGLIFEERLQALKLQPLGKRRLRNDLVQYRSGCNSIGQGLRRSSRRLLHQTGRTRRRRISFACRVVKNWNGLPFAVASVTEQRKFKQLLDS